MSIFINEINFLNLWFLFAALVFMFILSLLLSRQLNSIRLFHCLAIICVLLTLSMPLLLKVQPWYPFASIHVINLAVASAFLFALKFFGILFRRGMGIYSISRMETSGDEFFGISRKN